MNQITTEKLYQLAQTLEVVNKVYIPDKSKKEEAQMKLINLILQELEKLK